MVRIVRLGRNGSTVAMVVPLALRQALGWNRGDLIAVGVEAGRLVARLLDPADLIAPTPAEPATRRAATTSQ